MNFRVDFILESEQRSASVLSLKFLKRLAAVLIPGLVAVSLTLLALDTRRLAAEAAQRETEWRLLEPQKTQAESLMAELEREQNILNALQSWPESRVTVHDQFAALMTMIPPSIQLTRLNYDQADDLSGSRSRRQIRMRMEGRAVGENSEARLQDLVDTLEQEEPFRSLVDQLDMRGGRDTAADAGPHDRTFHIDCQYEPRLFSP